MQEYDNIDVEAGLMAYRIKELEAEIAKWKAIYASAVQDKVMAETEVAMLKQREAEARQLLDRFTSGAMSIEDYLDANKVAKEWLQGG